MELSELVIDKCYVVHLVRINAPDEQVMVSYIGCKVYVDRDDGSIGPEKIHKFRVIRELTDCEEGLPQAGMTIKTNEEDWADLVEQGASIRECTSTELILYGY